ncbi:MAG TPA: glycolate oxidase subunit GlcE, partial [Parasulfuritortus sp.]
PPRFADGATIGGVVAAGLSGPRRATSGSVRDFVLGVRLLDGAGNELHFGGQVMKNVAGYDVSRLMAGSLGTLGVILEASIKVLPRPAAELTLVQELDPPTAARRVLDQMRKPIPLSGSLYHDGQLWLRLCGSPQGVEAARAKLGGEVADSAIWRDLREQTLPYFQQANRLWRLSLPAAAPAVDLPGQQLTEWGGALRWLASDAPAASIFARAKTLGGHATLFRGHDGKEPVFQPLPEAMLKLHRTVKQALDPHSLFNPGRMYPEL